MMTLKRQMGVARSYLKQYLYCSPTNDTLSFPNVKISYVKLAEFDCSEDRRMC